MGVYKALVEVVDQRKGIIIDNIKANHIDDIDEKFIIENYPLMFDEDVTEDDIIVVMVCEQDYMTDEEMMDKYFYLDLAARIYEKYPQPKQLSKNTLKYRVTPIAFLDAEPNMTVVILNDKYVLVNPKMAYDDMDSLIKKEFGDELEDVKVYHFFIKDNMGPNSVICYDEWLRFVR